jgi:hypothetical protein
MATPPAFSKTPDGKAVLFHRSTGERFERWPVDAREMWATGQYAAEPPDGSVGGSVSTDTPPPAPAAETPQLPKEIAPGVPAVYTHARDAAPVTQFQVPTGRTPKKAG